jgi:DNA (cytosine-5)-methyltransferase 1
MTRRRREICIPVIDLFAGPGGLGEGFTAANVKGAGFKIGLSIEKDAIAKQTLRLRSMFRQFTPNSVPADYYSLLRGSLTLTEFQDAHPNEAEAADAEAWCTELGAENPGSAAVRERIRDALRAGGVSRRTDPWVLIGGPPCQPFSLAGRSRNKGITGYSLEGDARHRLYREYLRVISDHKPPVFVMENVKGILSAKLDGTNLFERVLEDLAHPKAALNGTRVRDMAAEYELRPLVSSEQGSVVASWNVPADFLIRCERYGVPQARHRVIVLGIRRDLCPVNSGRLRIADAPTVEDVIGSLPRLRSGLSDGTDSYSAWRGWLRAQRRADWLRQLQHRGDDAVVERLRTCFDGDEQLDRGKEFVATATPPAVLREWYVDKRLAGQVNHTARSHMPMDLCRYAFAACFAEVHKRSPDLSDFPSLLLPNHANAAAVAMSGVGFSDRFRVQRRDSPSTTIVSHISKDGHYYIHYDPAQCRALTVREAARLQTFPDNYLFVGPRTAQYHQVGNAVPPFLAKQIAEVVLGVLDAAGMLH